MAVKECQGYILYIHVRYQDGHHEFAKCFDTIEEALGSINKEHGPLGDQREYRLFELGKEIPLEREVVEEPQEPKKTTVFKVQKKGKKK